MAYAMINEHLDAVGHLIELQLQKSTVKVDILGVGIVGGVSLITGTE